MVVVVFGLSLIYFRFLSEESLNVRGHCRGHWAVPGVPWKKASRAKRAMRAKTLETVPSHATTWVHRTLTAVIVL